MNPFYRRAAPGWLCLLAACRSFPSPYTAADLQREAGARVGEALVHYLGQKGADAWVCAPGLRASESFTIRDFETFVLGLEHGDVPPDRWSSCARRLLGGLHGATLDHAVRELGARFAASLDARDNEPQRLLVLNALAEALESRPVATARVDEVAAAIGDELARRPLAVEARALATYVHEGLEISLGRFRGQPVDEEGLATVSDADALRRLARHLPTPTDRRAARARFLDLTIAASSSEWVRTHVAETRAQVLRTGRNALDLSRFPITHASCAQTAPAGTVVVEQNLEAQTARLLMRLMEETSLVPAIKVRGSLSLTLAGVHGPVTLCNPAEALDVTPCVDTASFEVASPFTTFDDEGSLHVREELTAEELASLLARGAQLGVAIKHGATQLAISYWPLRVLPPDAVVYGEGEPLSVTVARNGSRIAVSFGIHDGPQSLAFVEASDSGDFSIITRGATGRAGTSGAAGSTGSPGSGGSSATCPSSPGRDGGAGGHGGPGGRGGDGGPGGRGGDVHITLICEKACDQLQRFARALVRTEGGPGGRGGEGGSGGRGGSGGQGGTGTSCIASSFGSSASPTPTHLRSGSRGADGSTGPAGQDGRQGPTGRPGRIEVQVRPR